MTPPDEVVVAIIFPEVSTARMVPEGVAREGIHAVPIVRSEDDAFENVASDENVEEAWEMSPVANTFSPEKVLLSTSSVDDAELPPPLPVMQVPFTEKQPPARSIPPPKEDVADPVTLRDVA